MEKIDLWNTEIAFQSKSDKELKEAYRLFKMLGSPTVMLFGKYMTLTALKLKLPIKWAVRNTIFKHFCGGETIAQCEGAINTLDKYGIGTILDYSVEGKDDRDSYDATCEEILRTVEKAAGNAKIPFCVVKVTGICRNDMLESVSLGKDLTEDEKAEYQRLKHRLERIAKRCFETGTPLFVDAEHSWMQQAIDDLVMELMPKYNKEKPVVFNTLQMYRHDRLDHLREVIARSRRENFYYGVKLVRGAYMEIERERAAEKGYPDPIQPDKAATDRDYDAALIMCLDHIDHVAFCVGTHNEESSLLVVSEMEKRNISKTNNHVYFAQLYGMSDHISFNLSKAGYLVAKYVPYGPIKEVMPYLIRRAEENTSVAGQSGRELTLLKREMERRRKG